jgi:preprotein translocase subunit SecD
VYGRPNGLYGVVDASVGTSPLARFDRMQLRGEGVDRESGKRWLRVHFADEEAGNVRSFTATPHGRSLAVVVDGEVACHHKIRESVTGSDLQISCCNPHACDRWEVLLANQAGRN